MWKNRDQDLEYIREISSHFLVVFNVILIDNLFVKKLGSLKNKTNILHYKNEQAFSIGLQKNILYFYDHQTKPQFFE